MKEKYVLLGKLLYIRINCDSKCVYNIKSNVFLEVRNRLHTNKIYVFKVKYKQIHFCKYHCLFKYIPLLLINKSLTPPKEYLIS